MSLILRGFQAMNQKQIEIGAIGSTFIPQRVFAGANALFEAITGSPAIGAHSAAILPHDHSPEGGGATIPRGCIYSMDVGDDQNAWRRSFTAITTWARTHSDREYDLPCYVSPGIDTDELSVAGGGAKCLLAARVLCNATTTGGEIRIKNKRRTVTATSSTITVGTTIAWHALADVPCIGGQINDFDIEVQHTVASVQVVRIYAISLHEIRSISQPETNGTYSYSAVPRP